MVSKDVPSSDYIFEAKDPEMVHGHMLFLIPSVCTSVLPSLDNSAVIHSVGRRPSPLWVNEHEAEVTPSLAAGEGVGHGAGQLPRTPRARAAAETRAWPGRSLSQGAFGEPGTLCLPAVLGLDSDRPGPLAAILLLLQFGHVAHWKRPAKKWRETDPRDIV